MIGSAQFESLVELVNYYKRHPLYHKVKLCYPVNEDFVRGMGQVSYICLLWPCLAAQYSVQFVLGVKSGQMDCYRFSRFRAISGGAPCAEVKSLHFPLSAIFCACSC